MSDDENAELVHDWESDCYVLRDEITRLRAELAAVTAERDRMRQSTNSMIIMLEMACENLERPTHCPLEVGQRHSPLSQKEIIQRLTETCSFVRADLSRVMDEARAAITAIRPHIEAAERERSSEFRGLFLELFGALKKVVATHHQCINLTPETILKFEDLISAAEDIAAAIRSGK